MATPRESLAALKSHISPSCIFIGIALILSGVAIMGLIVSGSTSGKQRTNMATQHSDLKEDFKGFRQYIMTRTAQIEQRLEETRTEFQEKYNQLNADLLQAKTALQEKDRELDRKVANLQEDLLRVETMAWALPCMPYKALGYTSVFGSWKCLHIVTAPHDRNTAEQVCQREGGRLVILEDRSAIDVLRAYLQKVGAREANILVGAKWDARIGKWRWTDGTAVDDSVWEPGMPSVSAQGRCGRIWWSQNGLTRMTDTPCSQPQSFLCEIV